jgi:NAD-dependent deacetylase
MTNSSPLPGLDAAVEAIACARSIAVLTGAGISAESGVPTFRDAQTGLWARYRPEDLATPEAFLREPKLVWEWYAWRRELVAKAKPNAGHAALAAIEQRARNFTLITQNVDGLHCRAGSRNVLELHGNLFTNLRFQDRSAVEVDDLTGDVPPRCRRTGQVVRPGVVWFGETLPAEALDAAFAAAKSCDVMLSIGTSTVVEPAASLPFVALQEGAVVIELNPDRTPLTPHCTHSLRGKAAEMLPLIVAALPHGGIGS